MKSVPSLLLAHLRGQHQSTALLWVLEKRNGDILRGTDHDRAIKIDDGDYAGTYAAGSNVSGTRLRSGSDLSVDNMEVEGALAATGDTTVDVAAADIEAGLLNRAPVTLLIVNWASPSDGVAVVQHGYLGEIKRNSDRAFSTEIRGLAQLLSQTFTRTYAQRCQVREFGDAECGVDVAAITTTGTVDSVTSRARFDATLATPGPGGLYTYGVLTFTSGANDGYSREVKRDDYDDVAGHLGTWDPFPEDIEVGAAFSLRPGCGRELEDCKGYDNILNFRGYGIFIEGLDALMKGPT